MTLGGGWLFNDEWVSATHRLSRPIVLELLEIAGTWFDDYIATGDLEAVGGPVSWAGPDPAPVWFDVACEYTERWVHQQQIREAVGRPVLLKAPYAAPVIVTFVHSGSSMNLTPAARMRSWSLPKFSV